MTSYSFQLSGPFHLVLTKKTVEPGGHTVILWASVTPVDEKACKLWFSAAMNYADELTDETIRDFHSRIVRQDFPIVESQRPKLLPLDLQAELHLRFDKIAIAYRKWLKELGVTFGTS
jgi:phenylpropionate dioxygenase-like ring-hydroxylating dioxygenase large terminal subunit